MATAEFAVAVPAVVLVLAICLTGLLAGLDQVRCVDAAHLAARAAARGDAPDRVRDLARRAAPDGAVVSVSRRGAEVEVVVRSTSGGWGGVLPAFALSAAARTPVEEGPAR